MKIQPISDLHLDCMNEMYREDFLAKTIQPDADIIIMAGDIVEGREIDLLKEQLGATLKPIYYVAGNHEYWGIPHDKLIAFLKHELRHFHNVKVLENESVVIDDVLIIGGTLWTNLRNPINANLIRNYMRDFIKSPGLSTNWTNDKHDETVNYIKNCLKLDQWRDKKRIVVTHHGPSFDAVDDFYKFDHANCGYQSNLNHILYGDFHPDVWIHGHSHIFMDKKIGETRVIRNPLGYCSYGETTTKFDPKFMIDTDSISEVTQPAKKVTYVWDDGDEVTE